MSSQDTNQQRELEYTFTTQQLVMVRLPDARRNNALTPVPGVVVSTGIDEVTIRIRNHEGVVENITVSTKALIAR